MSREMPIQSLVTIGLEGMGLVAAVRGEPQRAARLWGATEALREATGEQRWAVFRAAYTRMLVVSQEQLPPSEWHSAWAAGRELTGAAAIAEILENAGDALNL
jgi:hypothetical protein